MNREFRLTSNLLRSAFAAVALTITVGLGAFIDTLAFAYGPEGALAAQPVAIVVAQATQ